MMGVGAFGGRWMNHEAMPLVEAADVLRADALARAAVFKRPSGEGVLVYRRRDDGPAMAKAEWFVESLMDERVLSLRGTSPTGAMVNEVMALEAATLPWGPARWWFVCPGLGCGRRAGCLYGPRMGGRYVCRRCGGLTYESRRESCRSRTMTRTLAARMGIHPRGVRWQLRARRQRGWGT